MEKRETRSFDALLSIHLDKVNSTNEFAKNCLIEASDKTVLVSANFQSGGKGQANRSWESDECQNVLMSLGLNWRPKEPRIDKVALLSMQVAISLQRFLEDLVGEGLEIKWPNDILFRGKKISGILIENTLTATYLKQSIIGTGINVNQEKFPVYLDKVSSLKAISGKQYDITELRDSFASLLLEDLSRFGMSDTSQLLETYNKSMIFTAKSVEYELAGEQGSNRGTVLGCHSAFRK